MNLFSVTSLKSCWACTYSGLAGVVGKVKMLWALDTSVWFSLYLTTEGDAVLGNL